MQDFLPKSKLPLLLETLLQQGYKVIAPKLVEGQVRLAALASPSELAAGWEEETNPGTCHPTHGGSRVFGPGPGSWGPRFLFSPPRELLFTGQRVGTSFTLQSPAKSFAPLALIGIKPCDLQAIQIMDAQQKDLAPSGFHARRQGLLTLVVDCAAAASTCFCTSLGQGPIAQQGFDVAMTELAEGFLLRSGSQAGNDLIAHLPLEPSTSQHQAEAQTQQQALLAELGTNNRATSWAKGLVDQVESKQWEELGSRCLACGNCTQACPTCFCHNYVDELSFDGQSARRTQEWDSCFFNDYSYLHGSHARKERGQRYRHWISHKLSHWQSQFGTPGCTGCGRCITWCPVGIDLRMEAERASQGKEP